MAEIVGLITGIGTIVTTALTITKTVSTDANDLGTAGSQIRAIAADTKAFALVLHNFKGRVDKNSHKFDSEARSVLKETVAMCKSEIGNMQRHLMPLFQSEEGHKMELKQKAKWLFAKSKVSTTKASLDSLKGTLNMLLHTMEYMEGHFVEDFIEEDIHEMIAASQGTKEKFLEAQRIDMTVEVIYDRIVSNQTPNIGAEDQPQQTTASTRLHEQSQISDADEATNHTVDMAVYQWASSGIVLGSERQDFFEPDSVLPAQVGQANLPTERALIETLSEEGFLQIADHIRLQRKVTEFALVMIAQPQKSEGHVFEGDQTVEVNGGARQTDEGLSDRFYEKPEFKPNRDRKSTDNSLLMKRKTLVRKGSAHPMMLEIMDNCPRMYPSHAKERPQEHRSHENEASSPRRDGIHRGSPSYPDKVFDEFMGGAPAGHQSYRSPSYYVPNFPPPWASAQQPEFYSNGYPDLSSPFIPMQFQQGGYHYPDRPTPPPAEVKPNPQMEQMKRQLELLQAERREQAESQTRAQYEERIRQGAERAFKIRMEEMQRAQEEAKREIELAKVAAERAARERLEKEQKQLEERRKAEEKQREYALAKAELEIRQRLEGQTMGRKPRQGLRGLFKRSS